MAFLGFLQVTAVVLNLLPIPGLDGYGALEPHLSPETQRALQPAKQWGFLILFILLFAPARTRRSSHIVYLFVERLRRPPRLCAQSAGATRFWSAWF